MNRDFDIVKLDAWQLKLALAKPYHLSKVYGTLTHTEVVVVRVTLASGVTGWGEADPGGMKFTRDTAQMVMHEIKNKAAGMLGISVKSWCEGKTHVEVDGSAMAALDVACHDAYARSIGKPVWQLLGDLVSAEIPVLWPTSSGNSKEDLHDINARFDQGFKTFMLKMGDREISQEIKRVEEVMDKRPPDTKIMVDANQGWNTDEALLFLEAIDNLGLVLVEQPLADVDIEGMQALCVKFSTPISADESIRTLADAKALTQANAADVFSIKVSKNGGLSRSVEIAKTIRNADKNVLMNSMIELGITQAASLHLACTLDNLVNCGHAYMSTIRMSDDISNFTDWVKQGVVSIPADSIGLGLDVSLDKINQYKTVEYHING